MRAHKASHVTLVNIGHTGQMISLLLLLFLCVCVRVEAAEGVGEPCDTDQLHLNPGCSDSKLLRGLWATAVLLGPKG